MVRLGRGREIEGEVPRAVALKVLTQTTSGIAKKQKKKEESARDAHMCVKGGGVGGRKVFYELSIFI